MPHTIGIDFGTESGRVLLLELSSGREVATAVVPYLHGVIDKVLPSSGEVLPPDWALQDPTDYLHVLHTGVPEVLRKGKVGKQDVIGMGIDFTSCTVLPVLSDATPLCTVERWKNRPHAWPKLWKHHSAQNIADRMNDIARQRGEAFLERYGGRISSEWYFPKLIEIFESDRGVYDACHAFVEAADWVVWYLTGQLLRNACSAGYKALWSESEGLPDPDYFMEVSPGFAHPDEKLGRNFVALGTRAGHLREELAHQLGLNQVAVAVGNVDAMAAVPGAGVSDPGALVMVMGTSICHLAISNQKALFPGVTGVAKDGILPGYFGYEAGQAAVGDMYAWFVKHFVRLDCKETGRQGSQTIYKDIERASATRRAGESGLLALDWWNGNRSILSDADLSGCVFGLTLSSTPEDVYRALLESTAFGTLRIIKNFESHGFHFTELVACGGLPHKSPLLMQIYADVCGLPVTVRDSTEISARGSAMWGAVAAGSASGGFDSIDDASQALAPPPCKVYQPQPEARKTYKMLYGVYEELYTWLGSQGAALLHQLKDVRKDVVASNYLTDFMEDTRC